MKRNLLKSLATLLCAVAVLFAFSSFTIAESSYRGGGDDETTQLDFHIPWERQYLDLGIYDYTMADVIQMPGAPSWVGTNEFNASDNNLCLVVEPNYMPYVRTASFTMTVYTSKNNGRVILTINIVQEGRP